LFFLFQVKWCNTYNGLWITGGNKGTICTWNPITCQPINTLNFKNEAITSILLDEFNDTLLLCFLHDYSIHMFSLDTFKKIISFSGHLDQVHAMVYISTRNQYLSSSWDMTLRVWLTLDADTIRAYQSSTNQSGYKIQKEKNIIEQSNKTSKMLNGNDNYKPFVSQYEKDHPITMSKFQEAYFKQKNMGFTKKFIDFEDGKLKCLISHQSSSKIHLGASLNSKIGALEALLRP